MRLCKCHDAFVNAKFNHVLEDGFAEQVPAAGVELTVTECACTAFAKKHIAVRVELSIDEKSADVAETFFYLLTLFVYIDSEAFA